MERGSHRPPGFPTFQLPVSEKDRSNHRTAPSRECRRLWTPVILHSSLADGGVWMKHPLSRRSHVPRESGGEPPQSRAFGDHGALPFRGCRRLWIEVGMGHWFAPPPPPNRTCGSPASGSPVVALTGSFLTDLITGCRHVVCPCGLWPATPDDAYPDTPCRGFCDPRLLRRVLLALAGNADTVQTGRPSGHGSTPCRPSLHRNYPASTLL